MEIRRVVAGEFFTNCYVVWGGKPGIAVLIDPADDAPGLLRLLDGLGLVPCGPVVGNQLEFVKRFSAHVRRPFPQ